jgi:Transcriptional regulator/sugar kinase
MTKTVVNLINQLAEGREIEAVGIAAAGFIDSERNEILYSPNLQWRHEPLRTRVQELVSYPVTLENDANAAAWAEFRFGSGKKAQSMVMLTIGTGVGGAIIADGKLIRGGFGIGGELGHIRLINGGRQCGCGQRGCLEQYGSGTAFLKAARKLATSDGPAGRRLRELASENGILTGAEVSQAITEGDVGALSLLRELGDYLGQGLASIVAALDPEVCIIGGGVSIAGEKLTEPIYFSYLNNLPAKGYRPELEVIAAKLGNEAGIIGAADLARSGS